MKILFITIKSPKQQGDYFELAILNGLKKILGNNIIDYPKKKIIYGDYSEVSKEELHGRGFSLLRTSTRQRILLSARLDIEKRRVLETTKRN